MQQRSEETRGKIIQAALECFSRTGYDATGVAEICATAGVSKGAFYHHFPSKEAVFIVLLNEWLAGLDMRFAEIRANAQSVPAVLRAMAGTARMIFADAKGQLPLYLEFWTQASREPGIWEKTVEPYLRYEHYLSDLIRQGIADGSLRPVDPDITARSLIALALGLLVQGMVNPDVTDWAATAETGIEMLLAGICISGG